MLTITQNELNQLLKEAVKDNKDAREEAEGSDYPNTERYEGVEKGIRDVRMRLDHFFKQKKTLRESSEALDELTKQAQQLGMGY